MRDGGRPAASSSVYLVGGHAFVTNIGAAPWARGRGLGTAATVATLRHAAALDHHAAVLVASVDGRGLYRRLGFREYGILAPLHRHSRRSPPTFEGGDVRRVVPHNAPRARWSGNAA